MKTGEKLKRIRKFRGYNQPEFAVMVGMGENAAPRIAQYESGYRVPSPKLLKTMAEVLDCNPLALMDVTGQNVVIDGGVLTGASWVEAPRRPGIAR